jgi:multidrug resistance protein, MATE family
MSDRPSYGTHARGLLVLALPIIGGHLANMLLHVTDTVMLGWYGVEPLAAVVLATSYFFFIFILGSGFGIGLMGVISASLGRGDETQVRRETRMGLWLSMLYGLIAMPLLWFSGPVLMSLGQKPVLTDLAQGYLRIAMLGLIPALLSMVFRSYFAAQEKASVILWVTLSSVVLNAVLNWMLIFGHWGAPELGLKGSAIATTSVQVLQAVLLASYAAWLPSARRFRLFQRFWRPDWHAFMEVLRLGLPAGLTLLAESGLFIAAALMMGWVGTLELAAHGIALQLCSLAFMVYLGLSNAATVKVGRAHGEGDMQGMRDVAIVCVGMTFVICGAIALVFFAVPRPLVGVFVDEGKADVGSILTLGAGFLAFGALFQLFDAMQVIALGFLRGVQDARAPMLIAVVSYWGIGAPASYTLGFPMRMGGAGIWIGLVLGLAAAAGALMVRFWRGTAVRPAYVPSP